MLRSAFRWCASVKLGVTLIVVLGAVLAWATLLEAAHGREYAQWHVYHARWFLGLLAMLAANILAAAMARWPWTKRHAGFLLTHAGLLVLLGGAIQTFLGGTEGVVSFQEGEMADTMFSTERSQLLARWQSRKDGQTIPTAAFLFNAGPAQWPEGHTLDLGELSDVHITVLKFIRNARTITNWVEDDAAGGHPALQYSVLGPDGTVAFEEWLVGNAFGAEASVGPAALHLSRISIPSMLEDFLQPPVAGKEKEGILSLHYEGKMERIPVGPNLGKKVPVGKSKISVEIVRYLPNAMPQQNGKFASQGDEPRNPLLELQVYFPDSDIPLRQIAFARYPTLSLDQVHGRKSPVTFWYHHSAVLPQAGAEFLQAPGGKLYCRTGAGKTYTPRGEVKAGDDIELGAGFKVRIERYLPHARREVTFAPVELSSGQNESPEAAALVAVTSGDTRREVWLKRNDSDHGFRTIPLPQGPLQVGFGYERLPLGFGIKLVKFRRETNPGRAGDSAFTSSVEFLDGQGGKVANEISMNQPATYGGLTFYQSSFIDGPEGQQGSVLSVAHDPGRLFKYLGSSMICLGMILTMFWMRGGLTTIWKAAPPEPDSRSNGRSAGEIAPGTVSTPNQQEKGNPAMRSAIIALAAWSALGSLALADGPSSASPLQWEPWRYLPVQQGGRRKPLDTYAWETLRMIGNRAKLADPQGGAKLDYVAAYLAMIFDWQGWDTPAGRPSAMCMGNSYSNGHKPDRWDRCPLILVEYLELRTALGMDPQQKHIEPIRLADASFRDPQTGTASPFALWANSLLRKDQRELSRLERKGLELNERLTAYREHRMGERLELLPVPGSAQEEWMSLSQLMRAQPDKGPAGAAVGKIQEQFRKARAAYQAGDGKAFAETSAALLASIRELGPKRGAYPGPRRIGLEVAYNRWMPFRFAWVLSLAAFLLALLGAGARWRPLYWTSLGFFAASVVAMLVGFGMRVAITGHAPVTNMYESVTYVGLGVAVFGLVFELIYRSQYVLAAAAAVATVTLILADNCPAALDPSLRPLQPVLRSNFWLVTHVMTITLSYAAFALALGIANITLGYHLFGTGRNAAIQSLSRFTYRVLQVGVLLLAVGTILGGIWADYSWGRFWGWDPKETWALIALLGYLAVLHARYLNWVAAFGLAALSVLCFSLVVVAWYGVNFVLGAGLHSYGFAENSGQLYVGLAIAVQLLYLAAAMIRKAVAQGEAPSAISHDATASGA